MARAEKELSEHLATIRADIAALSDTVAQLVHDTAGIQANLRRKVREAAHAGEEFLHRAEHMGEEALHAAARSAGAAVHNVEHTIERNPLTAVLVALGFGVVIGLVTRK